MTLHRYLGVTALLFYTVLMVIGCNNPGSAPTTVTPTPTRLTPAQTSAPAGATYVVRRGRMVKVLEFNGRIVPVEEVPLFFKAAGFVQQIYVRQGDQVKAGDLLAELESDELQNQIAQAELALNSAQRMLSSAERQREHQIALAELDLAVTQTRLEQAELSNSYAITQAELSLALAREELSRTISLGDIVSEYDIRIREIAVEQAEVALEQLKRGPDPLLSLEVQRAQKELDWLKASGDPASAGGADPTQLAIEQADLNLEQLKARLSDTQIVAPVDGAVISLSVYPNRPVEAFQTVIVIADPSRIEVSAELGSDQLKDMGEGQKATLVSKANPDRTWTGAVRRLPYPYGAASTQSGAGSDNSTRISLEGDLSELKLGELVQVSIVLEQKDNALWLPPAAIRSFQGRYFVIIQEGGYQRRVDVELGIEGQEQVEILEGLEEGQLIVAP